jgi:hypothetical protein
MHLSRNIEARLCNHCCHGKAVSIRYCVCVCVCVCVALRHPACTAHAPCCLFNHGLSGSTMICGKSY